MSWRYRLNPETFGSEIPTVDEAEEVLSQMVGEGVGDFERWIRTGRRVTAHEFELEGYRPVVPVAQWLEEHRAKEEQKRLEAKWREQRRRQNELAAKRRRTEEQERKQAEKLQRELERGLNERWAKLQRDQQWLRGTLTTESPQTQAEFFPMRCRDCDVTWITAGPYASFCPVCYRTNVENVSPESNV